MELCKYSVVMGFYIKVKQTKKNNHIDSNCICSMYSKLKTKILDYPNKNLEINKEIWKYFSILNVKTMVSKKCRNIMMECDSFCWGWVYLF